MELLPEWAPNLHPLIVHFPIAFAIGAIGTDLLSLLVPSWDWLRSMTVSLYVFAGISAVATYYTGTLAADAVSVPAEAQSVLTEHADLGWWTMWFFGTYSLFRLLFHFWPGTRTHGLFHGALLVVALVGGYLVYETGEHGAEMVYRYGVGVQGVQPAEEVSEPGLSVRAQGWQWRPQSDTAWTERMVWLRGNAEDVSAVLDTTAAASVALRLQVDEPVAFVVPDTLGAVQVRAELDRREFRGTIGLLHHVQDAGTYDYLSLGRDSLRQGRVTGGTQTVFARGAVNGSGWITLRAVGDDTHFRGYVGDRLVTHGHGDAAPAGTVGIELDGTGTVLLRHLSAEAL